MVGKKEPAVAVDDAARFVEGACRGDRVVARDDVGIGLALKIGLVIVGIVDRIGVGGTVGKGDDEFRRLVEVGGDGDI